MLPWLFGHSDLQPGTRVCQLDYQQLEGEFSNRSTHFVYLSPTNKNNDQQEHDHRTLNLLVSLSMTKETTGTKETTSTSSSLVFFLSITHLCMPQPSALLRRSCMDGRPSFLWTSNPQKMIPWTPSPFQMMLALMF